MKRFRWLPAIFIAVFLFGCYEVNEELVLNENGTGRFSTKMDLSQLIDMMQNMGGDQMTQEGLDKVIDTIISMKNFADSAKDITPQQRQLLSQGKLHMQMNMKEKIFKIDTDLPFKSYDDLQLLLSGTGSMSALGDAMKKVFDKGTPEKTDQPDTAKDPGLDQLTNIFDVVAKNGTLSKKINQDKFKTLMEKPEMEQMKQLTGAGLEILYTTVIKLPRPVISSDNPLIKLSEDKKTVTLKYNYLELFDTPDKFSYTITY